MAASRPQIQYFPLRGRAEVMRLALSYLDVPYEETTVDRGALKSDLDAFPFGQCPRFVDGEISMTQSNTILRYLGRKYGLLGANEKEHTVTDMVMEGVESLRGAYLGLIYQDALSDDSKARYLQAHLNKSSTGLKNKGAHIAYLGNFVAKSPTGYVAGTTTPTMGDLCLWEILDLHLRIPEFKAEITKEYPHLIEFYTKIAELPTISAYLPKRFTQINGVPLG